MTEESPQETGRRCNDCNGIVKLQATKDMLGCACSLYNFHNPIESMPDCW